MGQNERKGRRAGKEGDSERGIGIPFSFIDPV